MLIGWHGSPLPIANDTYVRLNTSSTAPATTRFALIIFGFILYFYSRATASFSHLLYSFNYYIFTLYLHYHSMEEGELGSAARQTLEAVQSRVEVELMAEPLLVSAALADSSHLSVKGTFKSNINSI